MKEQIIEYIKKDILLQEDFELKADDELLISGLIDSVNVMRLVTYLESIAEITVPPEDLIIENFNTANDIENYVNTKKAN